MQTPPMAAGISRGMMRETPPEPPTPPASAAANPVLPPAADGPEVDSDSNSPSKAAN